MPNAQTPFWEKTYQNQDITTFSLKPNATVKKFEHLVNKEAKILDVGCGEGQNAFYFAEHGYRHVDAFDLSAHGIAKLQHKCRAAGVSLHAFTADLKQFAVGLAKEGEIRELYEDWEILQFQSYTFEDEHPGVPKHLHASNKIVARKK